MSFIRNLKIRSKLTLLAAVACVLLFSLGIIAYQAINKVAGLSSETYNKVTVPMGYCMQMQSSLDDISITIRDLAYATDEADNANLKSRIDADQADLSQYINDYVKFLSDNNITSGDEYDNVKIITDNYPSFSQLLQQAVDTALTNDMAGAMDLVSRQIVPIEEKIANAADSLSSINMSQSGDENAMALKTRDNSVMMFIVLIIAAILILVVLALLIISAIVKPISRMAAGAKKIAQGDLEIDFSTDAKDETGDLSRCMGRVIDIVNGMVTDLTEMSRQHNVLGDIDVFVAEDKFPGKFGEVLKYTNDMVAQHIKTKKEALSVVNRMASGDFEADMEKLPGKKIFINEQIDGMRNTFRLIGAELHAMIDEALKGNLSVKARTENFSGGWAEIMGGLNELLESITTPVKESSIVLQEMAKGNLNAKVSGNFKGDLAVLSDSLNSSMDTMSLYVKEITYVLNEISNGNLNLNVDHEYVGDFGSIKKSLDMIIGRLNDTISGIYEASGYVAAGAKNISGSSMSVAPAARDRRVPCRNYRRP